MRPERRPRRRLALALAVALAATFGLAGTARAQDELPHVISPLTVASDQNGVNLIDGKLEMSMPVLEIPAAPHLRFDRIQNAAPYMSGVEGSEGAGTYSVHTGTGTSDSFRCTYADCIDVIGSGSTFHPTLNKYRQSGSGAQWTFNLVYGVTTASGHTSKIYYASGVSYPNGETITYSYDTAALTGDTFARSFRRPNRIESSLGYAITITYQGSDLNADPTAWGTPAQVTLIATAAPTSPIAWLTYSGDSITLHGAGETGGGRTWHCTGCSTLMGGELEVAAGTLQLPTEGAASTSVTAVSGEQVVASVTRDGVAYSYAYDNLRHQTFSTDLLFDHLTVTGPNSFHNVYTYDAPPVSLHSRRLVLTGVTDSIGRTTSYSYDEYFRPVTMTLPVGNQVAIGYDDFGNIIRREARPAGGGTALVETAHYMTEDCTPTAAPVTCYRADWSRDALAHQTDYTYNSLGQLTEQLDPADANGVRRRTTIVYTLSSVAGISRRSAVRICANTGASCSTGAPIQTEYDYVGETLLPSAVRQIDPATSTTLTTAYSYDAAGRLLSTDGPLSGSDDATYARYDPWGRKIWEIGAYGVNSARSAVHTVYRDSDDRVLYVETGTLPDATSTSLTLLTRSDFGYDAHRNPVRAAVSADSTTYEVTDKSYDDSGRLLCTATRMNAAIFPYHGSGGTLPSDACTLGTQGSGAGDFGPDRITRASYDAAGQRLQLREGVGTAAEGTEATWDYNANGQVTNVIDGNGNRATLRYDGYGRQDRWTFPSTTRATAYDDTSQTTALASAGAANASDYEQYGYDAAGNRTSLRKRDGSTLTYTYDNLNRVIVKTVPERTSGAQALTSAQTRDVYYGYDLGNRQLFARFDSATGEGVASSYDGFGRPTLATSDMGGTARTLGYGWDTGGRRTLLTYPDSTQFTSAWDAAGRLLTTSSGALTYIYTVYFPNGLRQAFGTYHTATGFGYDALLRPNAIAHYFANGAADAIWVDTLDPAGGIRSTWRDNDAYAWTGHYATNRGYTANGLNQYTAAGSASFTYDANGNLISDGANAYVYDIENRLVSVSGGHNATLVYDPMGRLAAVTSGSSTTRFLYDGDALVAEYNGSGAMTERHLHAAGADVPMVTFDGTSLTTPHYLLADHQSSIIASADSAGISGTPNTYDEYGIPGAANTGRFQYTGQAWLAELGMYYYKARIYSPTLGRFLQVDPIGYADQFNLYAYVGDDPVNDSDPSGMSGCADAGQNTSGGGNQGDLTGQCFNATRFDARQDGSGNAISSSEIDQSAREHMPSIQNDGGPNENLAQFTQRGSEVTFTPLQTTTTEGTHTTEGHASFIGNPQAIGHSQADLVPEGGGQARPNIAPGYENRNIGDHVQVNEGRPNYIINRGSVIVVERSQGQYRARVISGAVSSTQAREIRQALNKLQLGSRPR